MVNGFRGLGSPRRFRGGVVAAFDEDNDDYTEMFLNRQTEPRRLRRYPLSRKYSNGYIQHTNRLRKLDDPDIDLQLVSEVPFDELETLHDNGGRRGDDDDDDEDMTENTEMLDGKPELSALETISELLGIEVRISREVEQPRPFRSAGRRGGGGGGSTETKKSENFEVATGTMLSFADVGGYTEIKAELAQCVDMLKNFETYAKFNVRTPKGVILEGPPGCGKTLIAKALAGESGMGFIAVSGAEFQEKYVGVGPARIRELFGLAKKNIPCIVFIDEIDAIGRSRSADSDASSAERDSSLNELLVQLDGFKGTPGVFLVAATNRADLLDPALLRAGRIDKRIFVGKPDPDTRRAVIEMHISGKPYLPNTISVDTLTKDSGGMSCAEIENMLNEAMLLAIRDRREVMTARDIEMALDRHQSGYQSVDHVMDSDMIDRISVHEIGHAVVAMFVEHHAKVRKVALNLRSPSSPGYTVFEPDETPMYTRESLFEHLMVLLAGRLAEEAIYGTSVTTGAHGDFNEARKLAEQMVMQYGMGTTFLPYGRGDAAVGQIDADVTTLLTDANIAARDIVNNVVGYIYDAAIRLQGAGSLSLLDLQNIMREYNLCHLFHCTL